MSTNGATRLWETAAAHGATHCFANPGTTELALVDALSAVPAIRPVLCLFEGVCTGAADGFSRVALRPALTLLHLGPGFANGIANLHNARRAGSRVVNIVGDHASWHLPFDAPLTSDIESLARPVSVSVVRLGGAVDVSSGVARAMQDSRRARPHGVVTVIAPTDAVESHAAAAASSAECGLPAAAVDPVAVAGCARALRASRAPVIVLLGAGALDEAGVRAAGRLAESTGIRLIMEPYPAIVALGGSLPRLERLAYFPDDVIRQLGESIVVLAGARPPVSYFGYEGFSSELVPKARLLPLCEEGQAGASVLDALAAELAGWRSPAPATSAAGVAASSGALDAAHVASSLAGTIPEGSIVSLEGSTFGSPYLGVAHRARQHQVMTNTGGAIGQGLPCAVGAALAKPGSRVVSLQSDGSAQYTIQALWTMARENLDITVLIAANHRYAILQTELRRAGVDFSAGTCSSLTSLEGPRIDWLGLAGGYGVRATRVTSAEAFDRALAGSFATRGPSLIEVQLA